MLVPGKAEFGDGWEHVTTDLQDSLMLKVKFRPFFILPHVLNQSVSTQPPLPARFLSASSKTQFSFCGCFFVSFPPVQMFFQVSSSALLAWPVSGAAGHISCFKHHWPAGGPGGLCASWALLPGLCVSRQGRDSAPAVGPSRSQPVPSLSPHFQAPVASRSFFSAHHHPWVFCLFSLLWSHPRLTSCWRSQESWRLAPPEPWGGCVPLLSLACSLGSVWRAGGEGDQADPPVYLSSVPEMPAAPDAQHQLLTLCPLIVQNKQKPPNNPIKGPVAANTEWPQAFPSPGARSQAPPCGRFSSCATRSHRSQSPSAGHRATLVSHPVCRPDQIRDQFQGPLIFFRWPSSCPHLS